MRKWEFEDGIRVEEVAYDYDLHSFDVYNGERYLGSIYPACVEEAQKCIDELDNGSNPVADGWEDGMGNTCTADGWGEGKSEDEEFEM